MDEINARYACQVKLPGFGTEGQKKLSESKVLVVGAGGLGCPALQYLAAAGVGRITIADNDVVSESNLHRQILYTPADAGKPKAEIAKLILQKQNSGISIKSIPERITADNVFRLIEDCDIVLDCTDNFETRYLLNDACVLTRKPLVYGAIYQYEGQAAIWNVRNADGSFSPNYRDLFPDADATQIPDCATGGVLPTLAGIIGCIQAGEAIKYITGTGEVLAGKVLMLDSLSLQSRSIKLGHATRTSIEGIATTPEIPEINYEDLQKSKDDYLLIDVRTAEERIQLNIGGTHIPADEIAGITELHGELPVVLYCATGKRSIAAAKILSKQLPGRKIYSLKNGLKDIGR